MKAKKAKKWEFTTVLNIEFECIACETIHNIRYDVSNEKNWITDFTINCGSCGFSNKVKQ